VSGARWDAPGQGKRGFPGLSAYEIAVRNGFQGTEQQWLASLQGATVVVEQPGGSGGGSGTVTSVSASGSPGLTVGGSPITTSGVLTFTLSANLQAWNGVVTTSKADSSRTIATTAPLTGGGDLTANRTLGITPATTTDAGSMSAADKTKLDGIAAGAIGDAPSDGTTYGRNNGAWVPAAGAGTVTSVAVSGSTGLVVGGSPITGAGTITLTLDTGLQALANYNTSAFVVQTSTNVFAGRTLTGTAGRLSISNGTGVAGNPVFDIDPAYVGQTTITTLGTVTTGTWNATAIAANRGGTGQTSYAVGDLLYASSATALSKLADVAVGNALLSGGVGVAPAWGKIGLTTHVTGVLPVANGGTGQSAPSGTYVPTLTAVANVSSSSPNALQYVRVGNTVTVSGFIGVTPTATGLVSIDVSLPIASNFAAANELVGAGWSAETAGFNAVQVIANATNDRAAINFYTSHTGVRAVGFTFTYTVI
jgi:hypothetical protein